MARTWTGLSVKHYGPGPHKDGSPQKVHGGGRSKQNGVNVKPLKRGGMIRIRFHDGGTGFVSIHDFGKNSGKRLRVFNARGFPTKRLVYESDVDWTY